MSDYVFQFSPINERLTRTEKVYASIKEAILTLQLKPGAALVEDDLARQLGTSKTPVRDALLTLERDGLVIRVPYKGTYVAEVSFQDDKEVLELRAVLEGLAARLAATRITPEDLQQAERYLDAADEARCQGRLKEASTLGAKFHEVILNASDNRRLFPLVHNLDAQMRRLRLLSNRYEDRLEKSAQEHRQILAALQRRDPQAAEHAMRDHLESVLRDLQMAEAGLALPAQASGDGR